MPVASRMGWAIPRMCAGLYLPGAALGAHHCADCLDAISLLMSALSGPVILGVGVVAELRISDVPGGSAGRRRVEVLWQDGAARRVAVAEFAAPSDAREEERVRWYLEDYAEFPADPAPAIAAAAEAQLAQAGTGLFVRCLL